MQLQQSSAAASSPLVRIPWPSLGRWPNGCTSPFPILSDKTGRLGSVFGVFGAMGPVDGHSVFILGRRGHVRWKRVAFQTMHVPMSAIPAALRTVNGW